MLEEQAIIMFYKIDKAGYYAHNSKEPSFGNISEILVDLKSWAGSKELKQTKTYEANQDRYPCYLVDAKKNW